MGERRQLLSHAKGSGLLSRDSRFTDRHRDRHLAIRRLAAENINNRCRELGFRDAPSDDGWHDDRLTPHDLERGIASGHLRPGQLAVQCSLEDEAVNLRRQLVIDNGEAKGPGNGLGLELRGGIPCGHRDRIRDSRSCKGGRFLGRGLRDHRGHLHHRPRNGLPLLQQRVDKLRGGRLDIECPTVLARLELRGHVLDGDARLGRRPIDGERDSRDLARECLLIHHDHRLDLALPEQVGDHDEGIERATGRACHGRLRVERKARILGLHDEFLAHRLNLDRPPRQLAEGGVEGRDGIGRAHPADRHTAHDGALPDAAAGEHDEGNVDQCKRREGTHDDEFRPISGSRHRHEAAMLGHERGSFSAEGLRMSCSSVRMSCSWL